MTTTSIIEIKEQNANVRYENGRFSLNLKNHITLNDGDELNIKNIYIDSKKESNTISVPEDIILTMEVCGGWTFNSDYIVHYGSTDGVADVNDDKHLYLIKEQTSGTYPEDKGFIQASQSPSRGVYRVLNLGNTQDSEGRGNGMTYYPCYLYDAVGGDYKKLTFFQINVESVNYPNFGGFQGVFEYTNATGNKSTVTYTIPQKSSNVIFFDVNIIDGVIYREADGLTLIHPSIQDAKNIYNVQSIQPNGENVNNNKILHPKGQTVTIPIKAGNYQPSILAEKINFHVNNLNYNLESFINEEAITKNGPIFQNQGATLYGEVSYGGDTGNKFMFTSPNASNGIDQYYHMVSEDDSNTILKMGASVIDANNNNNIIEANRLMGGASNFEIIFDDITQTFKINNLHTPYYVSVGNVSQIGVKLQDFDVSGIGRIMTMSTKRADLKIFSLTTNEKTGNFWFDKLGFDESILTPSKSRLRDYGGHTGRLNVPIFNFNIKDDLGTRRTDAYTSLQLKLDNERFNPDYLRYSGDGGSATPLMAPISDTINIYGAKTLNDLIVDDAYFKIIIDGIGTSSKLYDEENIKLISAIVGKYYSGASYTNGYATDGINYIHRGLPITLSNFNVNILSSKNIKANIGPDNTIIIQVNKNEMGIEKK